MAASAGAWYRVGKVNVTNGNQSVVGVDTNWQSDVIAIAIGDIFTLDAKTWYEVTAVNSDASITLDRGFEGSTGTNKTYAIVRNTSGTILTRIAGQVSVQFNQKQLFLDELRTWLNSENASEELTDSHGLKQSLKTPSQMVRDHDNKLAELDTIHPYPYAMRKVEFEARRAANNEKFAASGFVHFGKHGGGGLLNVGEGLWTYPASGDNVFYLGRQVEGSSGESKTQYPVINIAGVLTTFNLPTDSASKVKLTPAEDGTRTYDSATGVSVVHATPAIAFASETETNKVVTDRVDMWGFEAFLREINDADPFVYKYGLIQSLATSINGVPTVTDNVRPASYFAWYEGEDSSTGKGVNWQTATEAQRIAIASEPENNIYFDDATGNFYQWCVRGRSFAGRGNGDWEKIDPAKYTELSSTPLAASRIMAQANSDANPAYGVTQPFISNESNYDFLVSDHNDPAIYYLRSTTENQSKAVNSECYFLVCGTVNRLNQGAYHPSFNPAGTGRVLQAAYGVLTWYNSRLPNDFLINTLSCFDKVDGEFSSPSTDSGSIAKGITHNGRPDGRFYDAIYASGTGGVCRDMRYSAWDLTQEDFAAVDLAVKSGEYRGRELLYTTKFIPETVTVGSFSEYVSSNSGGTVSFTTATSDNPRGVDSKEFEGLESVYWLLCGDNGETMIAKRSTEYTTDYVRWPFSNNSCYLYGSGDILSEFNSKFPEGTKLWLGAMYSTNTSIADEYTNTEVIGSPANILLCDDLKDGWVGSWNPVIPDGVERKTAWSRKYTTAGKLIITDNYGSSYSTGTSAAWFHDSVNNSTASFAIPENRIVIADYATKSKMTENSVNSKVYGGVGGVGDAYFSSRYSDQAAQGLCFSLTGNVLTNEQGTPASLYGDLKVLQLGLYADYLTSARNGPKHTPMDLSPPIDSASPAFKALNYNVAENQQGFINYAYTELTYDATAGDWGDDSKIHIADNQTTMLDTNGNTVKVGTARIVEPLGWIRNDK